MKEAIEAAAREGGVTVPIVAAVVGDDIVGDVAKLQQEGAFQRFAVSGEDESLWSSEKLESCNAYLGAKPIADALARGAQIVITGRVADSAIVLGPLMYEFGWSLQNYDALAAGSAIGHIIECGCHATGGNFTDWRDSHAAGWENVGFPIAECYADGSAVITKPDNTGGIVTCGTVAEQLVYEIHDPGAYYLPDVIVDFRQVTLQQVAPNRVLVKGARGSRSTPYYKVTATAYKGFQLTATFVLSGLEAHAKGKATAEAILARARALIGMRGLPEFSETRIEVLGGEDTYLNSPVRDRVREVVVRIGAQHENMVALGILGRELAPAALAMAPGIMGGASGRPRPAPIIRLYSALIEKRFVPIRVFIADLPAFESTPDMPQADVAQRLPGAAPIAIPEAQAPNGATRMAPLRAICIGRSGDKGDSANVGIVARDARFYEFVRFAVTAEFVKKNMGHLIKGSVTRYELPGFNALNFVCTQALGGGGMQSLSIDRQGKAFAQHLLSIELPIPEQFLTNAKL